MREHDRFGAAVGLPGEEFKRAAAVVYRLSFVRN
jgi:hypothetical protein